MGRLDRCGQGVFGGGGLIRWLEKVEIGGWGEPGEWRMNEGRKDVGASASPPTGRRVRRTGNRRRLRTRSATEPARTQPPSAEALTRERRHIAGQLEDRKVRERDGENN